MRKESDIPVLLVDWQYLTRKAISTLISEMPGFKLIGELESSYELNQTIDELKPHLLILEFQESNSIYFRQIESVLSISGLNVLIIINTIEYNTIQTLLKAGIIGIVSKQCSEGEIINALKSVALGRRFYCNSILNLIMEIDHPSKPPDHPASLSPRELEVLELIFDGNTTQKIAEKLHISVHTVNSHRKNILKKLNISSPAYLVAYAVSTGLVNINYKKREDKT